MVKGIKRWDRSYNISHRDLTCSVGNAASDVAVVLYVDR